MADSKFLRFFDRRGDDMNLQGLTAETTSLYDGSSVEFTTYSGGLYYPKISVNLIESQQIYILQEVTGPTSSYQLFNIPGTVTIEGGNPYVYGEDSDYEELQVGETIKIGADTYTILSILGPTVMEVDPTPSVAQTTQDIYLYDFLSYNQLRSSTDTFSEEIYLALTAEDKFFRYDVNYSEDVPYIERGFTASYPMVDGSSDTIDALTGRVNLSEIATLPTTINLGFSSDTEDIYEENVVLKRIATYELGITAYSVGATSVTFLVGGTSHPLYELSSFSIQGVTASGSTVSFYSEKLDVLEVGVSGPDTYIVVDTFDVPPISTVLANYRILVTNEFDLATISLYAETEAEDERFRLVLENFGRKIDAEKEYIFRESDISEELTDYKILNKKRKELLLAGDSIFPYIGSYRALINIINFFGYYDLRIKEYFLNVDENSPNFGNYTHILVPRNDEQRKAVKAAWELVPSKIYKKTSLFGLFYDLNRATEDEDIYGIPDVEDAFDFSPEEVLIKLFGLKELLKKEYLPLNARIYDITGEGIYFERIRIDSWADNLQHLVINLGRTPQFDVLPKGYTYISDLRRIDDFYKKKFLEQGLINFIGTTASVPGLTGGATVSVSEIFTDYVESYQYYLESPYDDEGNLKPVIDPTWEFMPPGISNKEFNDLASRLTPLPDDQGIVAGGPVLLEAYFDMTWDDAFFTWQQLGILGPSGAPLNINVWSWETLGQGEFIEMRWVIRKGGQPGFFYDSGRLPITNFAIYGTGATGYTVTAEMSAGVSGGSVVDIDITNAGFGYTTAPAIYITSPDTPGVTATATCEINDGGYVIGVTWTGGTGYTLNPTVTVEAPAPMYDITRRILHSVALPYTGEYDIALYLYDITNGFSVDFQKYTVKSREVEFACIFKKETPERRWKEFKVSWEEMTGPWYYPIHVESTWEDARVTWDSLDLSNYVPYEMVEYDIPSKIVSIDRELKRITLAGDLQGQNSLGMLSVGDYLFLSRDSSEHIANNLKVPAGSFGSYVMGLSGTSEETVYFTASPGATSLETGNIDTSSYLQVGDSIWLGGWHNISAVGSTSVELDTPLSATASSQAAILLPSTLQAEVGYTSSGTHSIDVYSRILCTEASDYSLLDPVTDTYAYLDGLTQSGSVITVKGDRLSMQKMLLYSLAESKDLYLSWGLFAGTYALQITNISLTGGNTQFSLSDPNKELYYLDGSFSLRLAEFDVDYAETRIGYESLIYDGLNESTWNENPERTWYGLEYNPGALCGFNIPTVAPGGNITVDEHPTFVFSGNYLIDSTHDGLQYAADELSSSLNEGIRKFTYDVVPDVPINVTSFTSGPGDICYLAVTASVGSNTLVFGTYPDGGNIKIPATLSVGISGGSVNSVTILNAGYGYDTTPSVTVSSPGGTGTAAVITLTVSDTPHAGRVTGVTWSGGSGYTVAPTVTVDAPVNYREFDNWVWTGYEWVEVESILNTTFTLATLLTQALYVGETVLLPYQYHKQIYLNPSRFSQFYFFIHASAKNPSAENLSYVNLGNGVESEWLQHLERTYTYPLTNSLLLNALDTSEDLSWHTLYQKWVYEGEDYPPAEIPAQMSSDVLSLESRLPYVSTIQSAFTYLDTVASVSQKFIPQLTPVRLVCDPCRIPGKNRVIWTIYNEDDEKAEAIVETSKLTWSFTKTGNYTVTMSVRDSNGNESVGERTSFVVVE